jgi:metal-responsive CopG/Arc/MetJ family transcriptional regulator
MKTSISIPDEVFERAERLAHRLEISRSRLYSRALRRYVARHALDAVTKSLDRLCVERDQRVDPFVSAAARRILERAEW